MSWLQSIVLTGATVAFALPLHAATVYSWENNLHNFAAESGFTLSADNSGTGVTDGDYALKIGGVTPGWKFVAHSTWNDFTLASAMAGGDTLQFDVTPGSSIPDGSWLQVFIQIIGSDSTWQTSAVGYVPINDPSAGPTVYSFDYTDLLPDIQARLPNWTGVNLKIGTNSPGGTGYAGDLFIDNLRVVPEPAGLLMLGLAIPLLRRRKIA